ncbi:MAG: hypothetical protein IJ896_14375 [Fibrobacter sp.]|nr:hypothetical protein [Fibrobacter sp.]
MNFRILAIVALLPFTLTFGQDVVRFYKGDSLTVKVTEIGESQIQYKRLDNLEGPVYTIKKSDVESITYANGNTDRFAKVAASSGNAHPLDALMSSICSKPEASSGRLFTIDYGETVVKGHVVSVSGVCKNGMKHGQFNFYDNEKMVMKTKFVKDSEVKTDCVFSAAHRRSNQKTCFDAYFK